MIRSTKIDLIGATGRHVSTDTNGEIGLHFDLKIQVVGLVFLIINGMRNDFGYNIIGQQTEICSFDILHSENIGVVFMKLFLYILLLLFIGTGYINSFETEIR